MLVVRGGYNVVGILEGVGAGVPVCYLLTRVRHTVKLHIKRYRIRFWKQTLV